MLGVHTIGQVLPSNVAISSFVRSALISIFQNNTSSSGRFVLLSKACDGDVALVWVGGRGGGGGGRGVV